ncbi:cryptochrome/photolyase family protein [Ahniella affigens]|uniref:Cryptochrome/photolyase family protein n=2 Tax=Ahniella affigens TaxID=2021234 RepID=A0A2P1PYP8_9GAMM|nr:cryptochrome/photolyase family protein [Ahniella affigens]
MPTVTDRSCRHVHWVLGDQLSEADLYATGFDPAKDWVLMVEAKAESTYVWSTKPRTLMFLAAMRHFAEELTAKGARVLYQRLDAPQHTGSLLGELDRALAWLQPAALHLIEPGEWRLRAAIVALQSVPVRMHEDPHFLCSHAAFAAHAKARKQLRMEYFYREMRARERVLLGKDGKTPEGGAWNFDHDNRGSFDARGPGLLPPPEFVPPDAITLAAKAAIDQVLPDHPGDTEDFAWPVTRADALTSLDRFIRQRLPLFGQYQDAMWTGETWLYHSHLSAALNLKLLNPREVIAAAEAAYHRGDAPLSSVEGFIRQILGWREYVRGIYWRFMPQYLERNALSAHEPLPEWYWTGNVAMRCLSDVITQTLKHGYAHHIQRLMVTGLYALLLGVDPKAVHGWYLAVYVDAIEWVELPNTLGMSQYADGGIMASKPYIASGKYIQRMSNYCQHCPFNPALAVGVKACPFTTLYWHFIDQHRDMLKANPRLAMQVRNLDRFSADALTAIRERATAIRQSGGQP